MLIKFNLIDRKENKISIEADEGTTIKDAIMDKLKPGNFALCGGSCICATCHIYIAVEDFNKLESPKEDEIETLETNDINQTKLSRLSCQIELKEEFNNITVTMTIPRTLT
jgi:2Fe-2S ferredoxin